MAAPSMSASGASTSLKRSFRARPPETTTRASVSSGRSFFTWSNETNSRRLAAPLARAAARRRRRERALPHGDDLDRRADRGDAVGVAGEHGAPVAELAGVGEQLADVARVARREARRDAGEQVLAVGAGGAHHDRVCL